MKDHLTEIEHIIKGCLDDGFPNHRQRRQAQETTHFPAQARDPFGLFVRLVRTGDPAARFTMLNAVAGVAATPLDMALAVVERRRYAAASSPRKPIVLVCGAPRTGTSLVTQTLIRHLPVHYFNNLTAVFSRSPVN